MGGFSKNVTIQLKSEDRFKHPELLVSHDLARRLNLMLTKQVERENSFNYSTNSKGKMGLNSPQFKSLGKGQV